MKFQNIFSGIYAAFKIRCPNLVELCSFQLLRQGFSLLNAYITQCPAELAHNNICSIFNSLAVTNHSQLHEFYYTYALDPLPYSLLLLCLCLHSNLSNPCRLLCRLGLA